jgi:hypothetical protein
VEYNCRGIHEGELKKLCDNYPALMAVSGLLPLIFIQNKTKNLTTHSLARE